MAWQGCAKASPPPAPLAHHSTSHPAQNEPQVSKQIEPEKEHNERIRKWPPGVSGWEASPQGPWSGVLGVSHLLLPRRRPSGKPVSWALQSVRSGHSLMRELGDPSNEGGGSPAILGVAEACGRWVTNGTGPCAVEVPLKVACLCKDTEVDERDGLGPIGKNQGKGLVRAIKGPKSQKEGGNVSFGEKPRKASWRKWYLVQTSEVGRISPSREGREGCSRRQRQNSLYSARRYWRCSDGRTSSVEPSCLTRLGWPGFHPGRSVLCHAPASV